MCTPIIVVADVVSRVPVRHDLLVSRKVAYDYLRLIVFSCQNGPLLYRCTPGEKWHLPRMQFPSARVTGRYEINVRLQVRHYSGCCAPGTPVKTRPLSPMRANEDPKSRPIIQWK